MVLVVRVVLSVLGLLYLYMGFGFLTDPVGAGGDFGVSAAGAQGLASIRGDFTAFFWVLSGSLLLGAWRPNVTLLYVAAALAGIVMAGRALGLALDGPYDQWFVPMTVEGITVIAALIGARMVPRV